MLNDQDDEQLVQKCIEIMREEKKASTTLFQRRLRVGYTHAAKIMDILEQRGYVGPADGSKPRQILDRQERQTPPVENLAEATSSVPDAAPETPAVTEAAPPPVPQQPVNPIHHIVSVDLYKGANGFLSLIVGKGLVLRGSLTFEEWREAHLGFFDFTRISKVVLADSINIAKREFGEVLVAEALQQMEFPWIEAKKAELIQRVPWQAREYALEEEHFFAAGSAQLPPDDTAKWLEIAVEEQLTPLELKRSIEMGKVIHNEEAPAGKGKNSGIVTIYAVRALYLQWKRSNHKALLEGPIDEQRDVLNELEPLCELIDKLRANIAT